MFGFQRKYMHCVFLLTLISYPNLTGGSSRFPRSPGNEEEHDHDHTDSPLEHDHTHAPSLINTHDYDNIGAMQEENNFARRTYIEKYGVPEYCVRQPNPRTACKFYVEISKEEEDTGEVHFELSGNVSYTGGYVAVGLSKDRTMGKDHIVECIKLADGRTTYYHSWSTGQTEPHRLQPDIRVIKMQDLYPKYEDGVLTCKFKRPIITRVEHEDEVHRFDLVHDKYHVIMSIGRLSHSNSDKIGGHGPNPFKNGVAFASEELLGHNEDWNRRPTSAGGNHPSHRPDSDHDHYPGAPHNDDKYYGKESNDAQNISNTPKVIAILISCLFAVML